MMNKAHSFTKDTQLKLYNSIFLVLRYNTNKTYLNRVHWLPAAIYTNTIIQNNTAK